MDETDHPATRKLLEAMAFAARAHQGQLRKDGKTPYHSHVFRVCFIVRDVFGVGDRPTLTAAVLHDTVEDTTTDFDDIKEEFGEEVASWVALLSKDKRRVEPERERGYEEQLSHAPWQVRVCKLADLYDNLTDMGTADPRKVVKTFLRAHSYLNALKAGLPEEARVPWQIVSELLAKLEAQQVGGGGA